MKDQLLPMRDPHAGYSDEELENLSRASRHEAGVVPWATWESENSSFGKAFREWAYYPKFLPLFISSDHGVHWGATCWPTEVNNRYKTYFSWNEKKAGRLRDLHQIDAHYVPHPWVHYRKKHFPQLPVNRSGTLVFFAHSNSTTTPVYEDLDNYINELKQLPEQYQPIVICLSFHDIVKGLHQKLRKYDLPLVSAGTTNSQLFVDRFYTIVRQFNFSTSPNIGSHTFYLIEAEIPFFLFGKHPEYHTKGSNAVKDGKQNIENYGDEADRERLTAFKLLLVKEEREITPKQYQMVSEYLGMTSEISRIFASYILWRELFRNFRDCLSIYSTLLKRFIIKVIERNLK